MQRNILEYLEATVRRVPDKGAFAGEEGSMSFRQVYDQARAIGSYLYRAGCYRKPIVVFMKKHPRTITAFLGAIYGGNYYVPLDEEMPRARMELILQSLEPGMLICDEHTEGLARQLAYSGCILRYEEAAFGIIDEEILSQVRGRQLDIDPIYIVFTSGSTGVPKGVMGCHRSVIDYIENLCAVLKFDEDTVFGNQTPLYFDACLKEIIPSLKYGATTQLIPKQLFLFPVQLVDYLNQKQINTLCWVVSALTMISSFHTFDRVKPKFLRTVAFASEVFPIRQLNAWRAALPKTRFYNLYGPTETTGICCWYEVTRFLEEGEALPIGRPFPNTEIILLDENGRVPAPGEQGEICIRGTRLTLGYYRDREKTDTAFIQNPLHDLYPDKIYRTGDIGRYNDRGELLFVARKDHQIKHMGHRIELGEIEAVLSAHPQVRNACCVYDPQRRKITAHYTGSVTPGELDHYTREKLPRYMIPAIFRQLTAMPLTPNGKIDRHLLCRGGS
ncbi:MAG: amino acid adenylation domain-containing protein [Oscillospiraceae bacterium]|nr:amino acid adenylation domain-containing protein [Oscillospiraceae bacterium]MBQ8835761.1 amino acid adenylation domain-containing protein [Oscillospiraceae bacterium]